jgi:K+-sensing histidine kinase KdpD
MVCIDGRPTSGELVRRAARIARRGGGKLFVLHVEPAGEREPDAVDREVEAAEQLGRQLGATVLRRSGDVAETVVQVAGELAVNQIVLGVSHRPRWKELARPDDHRPHPARDRRGRRPHHRRPSKEVR